MPEGLGDVVLVAATLATGLVAGLFYAFSIAVMPGLRRVDDHAFVGAMQQINVAILNGWFALGFGGAPVLAVLAALLHLGDGSILSWVVGAVLLHAVTLGITFGVNVPLNNELANAGDLAQGRQRFERRWVRWNHLRTMSSTAAFGCLVWALVLL